MATKEAQARASAKYDKEHTKGIYLKLNKKTDADILEYFANYCGNKQGLIKKLLRYNIQMEEEGYYLE